MLDIKIRASDPKVEVSEVMAFLDKKNKMPKEEFSKRLADYVSDTASLEEWLLSIAEGDMGSEIFEFKKRLESNGVTNILIDPSISRGFNYYTDIVFEVFDTNPDNNRSMFGGGRYDGLVGQFGVEPVPTVGFGMGDATFMNFLEANKLIPDDVKEPETDIYIATIGDVTADAQYIAGQLRNEGVNVAVDLSGKKLEKQIKTADKKGIEYVMFVGKDDIEAGKYKLKNLWYDDEDMDADTIQNIAEMIELRNNPMD